ncbi:hypothetical protein HBI60_227970 [Parastagonospora nodorum]|nr:hypothetical protein HBH82_230890 [Parastagonospora nodorum]KAH4661491.1 hypothetical protein HBH78_222920 [Parastagonospora nodorum]KAH4691688.1 hypothetical protein HBH67_239130 [Parastagonospora nodorum]KAH4755714.1 hypothetical protein HBH63_230600 [Parastagonospora nodorum]KAH4769759.1 hypothetical protein HBH62_228360 [Parastagonospora nodorum]
MAQLSFSLVFLLCAAAVMQSHRQQFHNRDRAAPMVPTRPPNMDERAHHGIAFEYYDEIVRASLLNDAPPATVHAPVFLFARIDKTQQTCYPEGAMNRRGDRPNPGQRVPLFIDPGADCTNVGPYHGDLSLGDLFPVWTSTTYCNDEWRIDYGVYYVHDGNLSAGRQPDWQGVSVGFSRAVPGEDWWLRSGVIFRRHKNHNLFGLGDVQTVDGHKDIHRDRMDLNRVHPKVYVGLYSHAAFPRQCSVGCGTLVNFWKTDWEYRSNDWYFIPTLHELKLYDAIPQSWCSDDAPWHGHNP